MPVSETFGTIRFNAQIDGQLMAIELHPCGADASTVTRALAALQGTMQALEDGAWKTSSKTTSQPPSAADAPGNTPGH